MIPRPVSSLILPQIPPTSLPAQHSPAPPTTAPTPPAFPRISNSMATNHNVGKDSDNRNELSTLEGIWRVRGDLLRDVQVLDREIRMLNG